MAFSPEFYKLDYQLIAAILCIMCSGSSSATATLFEGHQMSLEYLVRNLLKLYVDIEFTGSHTQVIPNSHKLVKIIVI